MNNPLNLDYKCWCKCTKENYDKLISLGYHINTTKEDIFNCSRFEKTDVLKYNIENKHFVWSSEIIGKNIQDKLDNYSENIKKEHISNFNKYGFHKPYYKEVELFFKDKDNILHGRLNNEAIRWDNDGNCLTHPICKIYRLDTKQTIYVKDNNEGFYPAKKLKVSWTEKMNKSLEETGWKKISSYELLTLINN